MTQTDWRGEPFLCSSAARHSRGAVPSREMFYHTFPLTKSPLEIEDASFAKVRA